MIYQEFENMADEQVVKLAQETDGEALEYLLNKYPELKDYSEKPNSVIVML